MLDELMVSLVAWIVEATGFDRAEFPAVTLRTAAVKPALSPLAPHLVALYDEATGTIRLAADWHADDPVDQSVLLHALLHHAQACSGKSYCCQGDRELEAYQLQARWLAERGIDFYRAFGAPPSLLGLLGLCPGVGAERPRGATVRRFRADAASGASSAR